jgi:hypothetical protein
MTDIKDVTLVEFVILIVIFSDMMCIVRDASTLIPVFVTLADSSVHILKGVINKKGVHLDSLVIVNGNICHDLYT